MSLDEIKLPDFIIADLYKNSLVELENIQEEKLPITPVKAKSPEPAPVEKTRIKFLGENKKKITVVVNVPKALFINEAELDFLTKILTACNLNVADIAIVNQHQHNVSYQELMQELNSEYILLFGVAPAAIKLPSSIPEFQVQPFGDAIVFHTPSLSTMIANTQDSRLLKSKLWMSLKTAFKL